MVFCASVILRKRQLAGLPTPPSSHNSMQSLAVLFPSIAKTGAHEREQCFHGLFEAATPLIFRPASHGDVICAGMPPNGW